MRARPYLPPLTRPCTGAALAVLSLLITAAPLDAQQRPQGAQEGPLRAAGMPGPDYQHELAPVISYNFV